MESCQKKKKMGKLIRDNLQKKVGKLIIKNKEYNIFLIGMF